MAKYVFCPWPRPLSEVGVNSEPAHDEDLKGVKIRSVADIKNVASIVAQRTAGWNKERTKKGKAGYTTVYWTSETKPPHILSLKADEVPLTALGKIWLTGDDQVYIEGHHQENLDFISDITKEEDDLIAKRNQALKKGFVEQYGRPLPTRPLPTRPLPPKARAVAPRLLERARKLMPEDLARRFRDCFQASPEFTGKIKFYNCSSGYNGGASFAKPAADRLRASWPKAKYIGYTEPLSQKYGDYSPSEFDSLQALLANSGLAGTETMAEGERPERRKLGLTSRKPAKELQIHL
jgi:hypothetical protein